EPQDRHALVTTNQLGVGAGRTCDLTALAGLHLYVVHDGTDRHRTQRHRIARLHVDVLTGHDLVAGCETLRRQDVAQLAVLVLDEGDERRAVRVILEPLDRADHVELATLEIDDAVRTLVTTADEAGRHATCVVAAALLRQAFGQALH